MATRRNWWLKTDGKNCKEALAGKPDQTCRLLAAHKGYCRKHARKRGIIKVCLTCGGEHEPNGPHVDARGRT